MQITKKYYFIFTAMIFLFFGLTSSPTLVAGYHIFLFIPTLLLLIKGSRIKLQASSLCLIGLIIWGAIATTVNLNELVNINKSYQELKYYFFGVFCILTLAYFFTHAPKKHVRLLLNLLLFTIVVGLFVGIARSKYQFDPVKWSFVGDKYHTRVGGFTNYMRYGYSSALMFVLGLGAWFNYEAVKAYVSRRWLYIFMSFNFIAIIVSETRGALLALIAGTCFLLLKYKPKVAKVLISLGIVGVISIASISFIKGKGYRYLNINDGSNKKRLSQFYSAVKSIEERPIFGLGADQFSYNVPRIKEKYDIWSKEYSGHSHNIFLEHAANYGIPGLLFFLGFLVFWFIEMIKRKTHFSWVVASYIVAFVIGGQVELLFDVINSHLIFFMYSYSQRQSAVLS